MEAQSPLQNLIALEVDTREYGFIWPDAHMILDQVHAECDEVKEALVLAETPQRVQEEVGDLLHTAISLCLFLSFDVNETLDRAFNKFSRRMQSLKNIAQAQGVHSLHGKSTEELWAYWKQVKALEKNND